MAIKNLVDAAMKAFENGDTKPLKRYLRRGSHSNLIFPSAGHVRQSTETLFLRQNATLPENFSYPNYWSFNYTDTLGNVLLHLAVIISDYELTSLLLEKGADITSVDRRGRTALHIACQENSLEIIKLLAENSPAYILDLPNKFGHTPFDEACRCCCPEVVQLLLSKGSSVIVQGVARYGPLIHAAFNAAEYAVPITTMLLDAGANINHVNMFGKTALIIAVERSASEANSNTRENYSYKDLCMLLIDRGCNVNAADSQGRTALHIAVETEQEDVVRRLLLVGSDPDSHDIDGFTPLFYACVHGSQRLVELLIMCGSNLQAQDWEATIEMLRSCQLLNEENIQVLNYVLDTSKQCPTLGDLCNTAIRHNVRNVEKDAVRLPLPSLLIKRLQLKE